MHNNLVDINVAFNSFEFLYTNDSVVASSSHTMATWNGEDYVPDDDDDDENTNQLPVPDSFHCGANNIHSQIEGLTTKTKKMTINSNDAFEGTTGNTH